MKAYGIVDKRGNLVWEYTISTLGKLPLIYLKKSEAALRTFEHEKVVRVTITIEEEVKE